MSLFVCQECRSVENTALSNFWLKDIEGEGNLVALCSACDPKIAKWHGRFPKVEWDGERVVQWVDGNWVDGR